jgi:anaerobic magnesium-protoporphyrin IX monomethyl ester cyclase
VSELFLFVRPPRPLWPFNGPSTAFWPPLAFASLAAAVRDGVRNVRVEILDAPALRMGWRTLTAELARRRPAYVGIGEEAVSCVEGLRLARLAHDGGAKVVAGGCFFGHTAPGALATGLIDVVVHGEGEQTIVELVETLRSGRLDDLARVAGISYLDGDRVVTTEPRPLIEDLDRLPFPAYDLLPIGAYGRDSRNHTSFGALELSRGCVGSCGFCVLWRQMGRVVSGRTQAQLRVKSPERAFDEVQRLQRQFGRRYIGWVDPCFNADPRVPGRVAEMLLEAGLCIGQSAWIRADGVVRDAASGALDSMVRSGLNEVYLGVERPDNHSLTELNKTVTVDTSRRAFDILAREHPQVYTVGSFIYGLPGDTPATVRAIHRLSIELVMDMAFFIPLTPLPGTEFWRPELWDATGEQFRHFTFLPSPIADPARAALDRALLWSWVFTWSGTRVKLWLRAFCSSDARRRRMQRSLAMRSSLYVLKAAISSRRGHSTPGPMIVPRWYES